MSSNLVDACRLARSAGASVVAVTGFDGGMGEAANVHINVPFDQEPAATPVVESIHVLVHHALCMALRERMADVQVTP